MQKTPDSVLEAIEEAFRTHATTLDLSRMGLTAWPTELVLLNHLEWLDLSVNLLTDIPSDVANLANLSRLDISENLLTKLPDTIKHLVSLTTLNLRGNALTVLPREIASLRMLSRLDLSNNQLKDLPHELESLETLSWLNVSENELIELPLSIGKLRSLTELDASRNRLLSLPPTIGKLRNLRKLDVSSNRITTLPPEIGHASKLEELYVSHNLLLSVPSELGKMENLKHLNLSYNLLTELPKSIGLLKMLHSLDCTSNQLSTLPPPIGRLTALSELRLGENQLTSLPLSIGNLGSLSLLVLSNNSLPIPPEILGKSDEPRVLTNYYIQHTQGESRPLNEAKLLLVGQGSVGKTSLARRLAGKEFDSGEGKTDGISIGEWHIVVNERHIRLNVWDFGGQEIMHATHQFFLTRRSVYVLVLDARQGEDENRIDYWLKMIQSFGGDSPVIVVGNKVDEHPLDLDRKGLQEKYRNIKAFVETSCKSGHGIPDLHNTISTVVAGLEHINDKLLLSWFQVKSELERMEHDYLPYKDYVQLCTLEGVLDEVSQRTLIRFLHDLGIVLNFQDDPRLEDTNVLNPAWITNGVYQILNSNTLMTESRGVLDFKKLSDILDPRMYPRNKQLFIIEMMLKFELCFPLEHPGRSRFLIPDLLTKEEPDTGDWSDALLFQYHYSVLPTSVVSRFIVRVKEMISNDTYWRNGVVLKFTEPIGNEERITNRALIKADREQSRIQIRITGNADTRRRCLAVVRAQFDSIHKTLPSLEVTEEIPIPGHVNIVIDYRHLINLERIGDLTFVPSGLTERVSVRWLLDGIEAPRERWNRSGEEQTDALEKPIQAIQARQENLASSVADEADSRALQKHDSALRTITTVQNRLDEKAERYAKRVIWLNAFLLGCLWAGIGILIYVVGWETMEPWTFIGGGSVIMIQYLYFAITRKEFSPNHIYRSLVESRREKEYSRVGLRVS